MNQYYITDSDVTDVLGLHGLNAISLSKLPKSGQRQVFEVVFDSNKASMLKFVDVSPYIANQRFEWNELSEPEFKEEKDFEIEANSKRIVRELEASKKCAILPQLEILGKGA